MKNPRLLIVGSTPPPYSGYETATEVLMRSDLHDRYEIELFDTRTTLNPQHRGKWSIANILSTFRVTIKLIWHVIRFRPDIANIPLAQNKSGFLKWMLLASICKMGGAKVISRLGGDAFDKFYAAAPWWLKRMVRMGLRIPSVVIVRGVSLIAQFEGLVPMDRIHVVPNGFDIQQWLAGFSRGPFGNRLRIFYIGQVTKAKGALDLLEASGRLKDESAKLEFVFAGPILNKERNILHVDNPENTSEEIAAICKRYDLPPDYVRFVGAVSWEEKRKLFAWADVVVIPSYSEGFPYTVLEAFASQCAVVCTPVGALPDYLANGREVLFVPANSPDAISEALLKLEDPDCRHRLVEAGREYLVRTHDVPVFSRNMDKILGQLIAK